MTWRRGFTRLWIVLTAAWITTIVGIDRPDKQLVLAHQPIEIPYGELTIEFPVGTDQDTIAGAINKWIAAENAALEKLRTGEPLSSLSDEELGLTGKGSTDIRRQIENRMPLPTWMMDPLLRRSAIPDLRHGSGVPATMGSPPKSPRRHCCLATTASSASRHSLKRNGRIGQIPPYRAYRTRVRA
jgi:hypothetical protein